MAEKHDGGTNRIDDELANATDQIMSGAEPEDLEIAEDVSLLAMTVHEIRQAFGEDQADAAMAARIRANIAREWRTSSTKAVESQGWQRWLTSIMAAMTADALMRSTVIVGAVASVILVFWCALAGTATGSNLPGSAGNVLDTGLLPVLIVGGAVVLAGVVWWLVKPRNK